MSSILYVLVCAFLAGCKQEEGCVDVSGLWSDGLGCFNASELHVSQTGCSLQFDGIDFLNAHVVGSEIRITTTDGLSCKGKVEMIDTSGGSYESIDGECSDAFGEAQCSWAYRKCSKGEHVREEVPLEAGFSPVLPMVKDPRNNCRCLVPCTFIETLPDIRACSAPKIPYDVEGDTVPDLILDDLGLLHRLCELPQSGTIIGAEGTCELLECSDPTAQHSPDAGTYGWYYDPNAAPTIDFSDVMPESGSSLTMDCCIPF